VLVLVLVLVLFLVLVFFLVLVLVLPGVLAQERSVAVVARMGTGMEIEWRAWEGRCLRIECLNTALVWHVLCVQGS